MLNWQRLFDPEILQRGREYYKKNKVRSLIQDGERYYAAVEGTEEYQVEILIQDSEVTEMQCECPWAEKGNTCKHEAATLYEIVAREKPSAERAERKKTNTLLPFAEESDGVDGEYHYFLPSRFTSNLRIDHKTYLRAEELLDRGELRNFSAENRDYDTRSSFGNVVSAQAFLRDRPYYPIRLTLSRDRVLSLDCPVYTCGGYGMNRQNRESIKICEHCMALLILTTEEIRKRTDWDTTDRQARRMLERFWEFHGSPMEPLESYAGAAAGGNGGRTVILEPRLLDTADGLRLDFRIGTEGKLYVLKDLEQLTEAVRNGIGFELGSKAFLNLSADRFDEKSEAWFALIRQAVLEERVHAREKERRQKKLQGILLYGTLLDDFYDLAEGTELELRYGSEKRRLSVTGEAPKLRLELRKETTDDGVFHGAVLKGKLPEILNGVCAQYCTDGKKLWRVEGDRLHALEPLFEGNTRGLVSMHVGRSCLADFYYHVLPELRKSVEVDEPDREEILSMLPPEAAFRFLLDAEDGTPVCHALADYGEQDSYLLTDWKSPPVRAVEKRDRFQESAVLRQVEIYFPDNRGNGDLAAMEDEDSVFRVLNEGVDVLCRMGEVLSTARFDALTIRRSVKLQLGISVESGIMDLKISSEDVDLAELAEILASYRLRKKYHRLKSGEFVRLDQGIEELAELADALQLKNRDLLNGEVSVPAFRAFYLEEMLRNTQELYSTRDRHYRKLIQDFSNLKDAEFEVPDSLKQTIRSYQVYGYKWLRSLAGCGFGGILADEMGLGKTIQIIAAMLAEKQEGIIGTSLVICPASLVYNWVEELHRFAPELSVCPVEGNQAERWTIIEKCGKWDVLISSYDHLKRDIAAYEGKLFLWEVLDEAQFIKNQTTSAAKAVKVIHARHRFALTGTPIENRLSELWSIFDFLMPGFLYRYETFRNELEKPITRDGDGQASRRLRRMVAPFILRRLKTDVLKDLPEKVEESRIVHFEDEQQKLYDAQVLHMKSLLEEESDESFRKSKIQILAELMKIRQICCDPALLFEDYSGGSAKLEACMDLIHSAMDGGHRILLFSQFTSMLDLLKQRLQKEQISYYEITGATPKKERLQLVSDFNSGEVPLFLISLRAGGTGLNLTGADIVIHYDPWWNAAAQNQATDRAHRIGQRKPVTVYRLLAKDTIEEKIQQLQEKKLLLADEIIGGEQVSLSSLTREELLGLIG